MRSGDDRFLPERVQLELNGAKSIASGLYPAIHPIDGPSLLSDTIPNHRHHSATASSMMRFDFGVEPVHPDAPGDIPVQIRLSLRGTVRIQRSRTYPSTRAYATATQQLFLNQSDEPLVELDYGWDVGQCPLNCIDDITESIPLSLAPDVDVITVLASTQAFSEGSVLSRSRAFIESTLSVSSTQMIRVGDTLRPAAALYQIELSPLVPEPQTLGLIASSIAVALLWNARSFGRHAR